ncbi:MAG: hypothetical protein IJP04_05780, partial [Clostridia bacterium]|nr:hypothetical protein [Clostridia bacterium]
MNIRYDAERKIFHLQTREMSYVLGVTPDGRLLHLYWGKALENEASLQALATEILQAPFDAHSMARVSDAEFEVPTMEAGDFQLPLIRAIQPDGVRSLRLRYNGHEIHQDCLTVKLRDAVYPLQIQAHYRLWRDLPLVSRWLTIENYGVESIALDAAKSACFHVPKGHEYRLTHLAGEWGSEYGKQQLMLTQARVVLQN